MDSDGSNQRMLRGSEHGGAPAWSPDGSKIAFCQEQIDEFFTQLGTQELWVVNIDGNDPHRVAQNVGCDFAWSPSGQHLVYTIEYRDPRDIYVVTADGPAREKLVRSRRDDWRPVWSPEGRRIAFSSRPVVDHDEVGRASYGSADIFTIDVDTKQQRRLTHAADGEDNYMSSWHQAGGAEPSHSVQHGSRAPEAVNEQLLDRCWVGSRPLVRGEPTASYHFARHGRGARLTARAREVFAGVGLVERGLQLTADIGILERLHGALGSRAQRRQCGRDRAHG